MTSSLKYFFTPRGVALIGASANPAKLSHGVLLNMKQNGYQGAIYPVNPSSQEILGLKCYADISAVPDPIELAVVMLPAQAVLATIEACGKRGLKAVIIISGGFKEVGIEGADLEKQCIQVARQYGMRVIGPNCVGIIDYHGGLNTTFIRGMPDKGPISFVSQSGAVMGAIADYITGKGVNFSHMVSMGNEADVNETDLIEYMGEDPNVGVIVAYVEAIQNGERFIKAAAQVSRKKPIVILKAGNSEAGAKAVSSHTGSLAGSYAAYQSAFQQSGAIEVNSAEDLLNIGNAFAMQPIPTGKRVAILTNAGGPAALVSDGLSKNGLKLADLSQATQQLLREKLVPSAQVSNPVDMLGGASPQEYGLAVAAALADPQVDIVIAVHVPTSVVNPDEVAREICKAAEGSKKTILACVMGDASIDEMRLILHRAHIPLYIFPDQVGRVLGAMLAYSQWLAKPEREITVLDKINTLEAKKLVDRSAAVKSWGEAVVRPVLAAYGIPLIPGDQAHSADEAVTVAEKIGYPVVMKIVSPDILHKSDAGGIQLNLKSADEIRTAYQKVHQNAMAYNAKASLEGVLVEKMAGRGQEVIIGMRRDPQFGPLVMFGLGGIYVELFTDIAFRVAPLTRQDVEDMIMGTKAGRLLSGLRGQKAGDIEALVDCILRLGQLALDFPQISEIEINPLLVFEKGQGVLALDARAIL